MHCNIFNFNQKKNILIPSLQINVESCGKSLGHDHTESHLKAHEQ